MECLILGVNTMYMLFCIFKLFPIGCIGLRVGSLRHVRSRGMVHVNVHGSTFDSVACVVFSTVLAVGVHDCHVRAGFCKLVCSGMCVRVVPASGNIRVHLDSSMKFKGYILTWHCSDE